MQIGARWRAKHPHLTFLRAKIPQVTGKPSLIKRSMEKGEKGKAGPRWLERRRKVTVTDHSICSQSKARCVRDRPTPSVVTELCAQEGPGTPTLLLRNRTWPTPIIIKDQNQVPGNSQTKRWADDRESTSTLKRKSQLKKNFNMPSKNSNQRKVIEEIKKLRYNSHLLHYNRK